MTIDTGVIAIHASSGNNPVVCTKNLDAQSGQISVICELASKDGISGDLDFAGYAEATGTYQVGMELS